MVSSDRILQKRADILHAAAQHFARYGYNKTTVSDLARSIGYSKGYIYKFFDSKQAIGESICASSHALVIQSVEEALAHGASATKKFRRFFTTICEQGVARYQQDRKLHDIAAISCREAWPSSRRYRQQGEEIVRTILMEGRQAGEFERKTPLDEVSRGIMVVMQPFLCPALLEHTVGSLPLALSEATNLVLRSLAP